MNNVAMRVAQHREKLRAAGLRPVQVWVPDARRKGFHNECMRQSLLLKDDPQEAGVHDWLEQAADTKGWI